MRFNSLNKSNAAGNIPMDNKQAFFNVIYDYYRERAGATIKTELLKAVSEGVTDHYYEQYSRFRVQYPKSVKRYSAFLIDDLDHPQVFEIVNKFFKENTGGDYSNCSSIVLGLNLEQLRVFEKRREDFNNWW